MSRRALLGACVVVIVAGLALRLGPWDLPLRIHHFGGGLLWGAMVYLLAAAGVRPTWRGLPALCMASTVVVAVEGLRLFHEPRLDAFRVTMAGQLLLGHIFSPWNILVDEIGAALALLLTLPFRARGAAGVSRPLPASSRSGMEAHEPSPKPRPG